MHLQFSWRGAASGGAAGIALVAAMLSGWLTSGIPVIAGALWERALRLLPMEVFGFLITRLKFAAKPLAFWAVMAALVGLCAAAGGAFGGSDAGRRRRWLALGLTGIAAVAVLLGLIAAGPATALLAARLDAEGVPDPEGSARRAVAAAIAGYALLAVAVFAAGLVIPPRGPGPLRRDRREFLRRSALLAAALAGVGGLAEWARAAAAGAQTAAQSLFGRIKGLPPEVTPTGQFYVVSKNPAGMDPRLDASRWSLEIAGLVGRPVRLTYDQIRGLPAATRYHTLECISNEVGGDLIGNALWKGVRFRDLMALAGGVKPQAVRFALRCADGYTEGLPVGDAMHPETLLAYEMNGAPLTPAHGFPVRLLVPGLFGLKNPKWLTRIEAVATHFTGYWQASGWSDEAVVKTTSMFRVPGRGPVRVGEVALGGVAYSGDRGIQAVEVSPDGGRRWFPAVLKKPLGPHTWVLWAALWTPPGPGEYTLQVRARDGAGLLQTAQEAPPLPDGASGYHTIRVRVRA